MKYIYTHHTIGLKHGQRIIAKANDDMIYRTGIWDSVVGFVGDDKFIPMKGICSWFTLPMNTGYSEIYE